MAVHISAGPHDHKKRNKRAAVASGTTFPYKVSIGESNIVCNRKVLRNFMLIITIVRALELFGVRPSWLFIPLRRRRVPKKWISVQLHMDISSHYMVN